MKKALIAIVTVTLSLHACAKSHSNGDSSTVTSATVLPAPERPNDVLVEAHFGQPRATVTTAGRLVGTRIPFELGLAVLLGINSTILSATDTAQPIDVLVTGTGEHPDLLYVLTPAEGDFRSTLSSRFRFTTVANLGDRLDVRTGPPDGLHCAIVGVSGTPPARIVCASRTEALDHAGRFAAFSAASRSSDHSDAVVDVDAPTARRVYLPLAQAAIAQISQSMAASAAEQRREHDRAPDYGDPEAVVRRLTTVSGDLETESADVRHVRMQATLDAGGIRVEGTVTLDPAGASAIVRDATARLGATNTHALASRLAPDSMAVIASHSAGSDRIIVWNNLLEIMLDIAGTRIPDHVAAQADLTTLMAHDGDEFAVGAVHGSDESIEMTALFSQNDGGAGARAALTQIARASWLRGTRAGDVPVIAHFAGGVLTLELGAAPHAPHQPAAAAHARPTINPTLSLSVVGDALVVMIGTHNATSLAAIGPRTDGPTPAVLASARPSSFVGALDTAGTETGAADHAIVSFSYSTHRGPEGLVANGRLIVPVAAVHRLRTGMSARHNATDDHEP